MPSVRILLAYRSIPITIVRRCGIFFASRRGVVPFCSGQGQYSAACQKRLRSPPHTRGPQQSRCARSGRREMVGRGMAARGNRNLCLMDLGGPRNIESSVGKLYNVYVYSIDDLSDIVLQNRNARENEIPRAEGIVEEHVGRFLSWQASVELVGLVDSLRNRMREERASFIRSRVESVRHLTEADRARVEKLMDDLR